MSMRCVHVLKSAPALAGVFFARYKVAVSGDPYNLLGL